MAGWIAVHRCIMEKAIWHSSTPEQKVILITLLLMANHKETEWEWKGKQFKAKSGQFVTSIASIKKKAGKDISSQNVRTAIKKFENYGFLTNESTKTGRLISIVNWHKYQDKNASTNKGTNKDLTKPSQSVNKDLTTNNNDNNVNNDNNKPSSMYAVDIIWNYYLSKIVAMGKVRKKTEPKIKHINARLEDGFTVDQLKAVIDKVFKTPYMLGENDKKKLFIEIENFFRNTEKVEKWLERVQADGSDRQDYKDSYDRDIEEAFARKSRNSNLSGLREEH